ncbi:protease pro-enzyme activation domain-containing protein [Streptomyces sp. DW26H14]|uniref:protease pro-enzyme activation domain-containing protein n=1 Tax=Streptomyces sp. DW26H14 TaxID=3435395 RepID=UPI00403DE4FF
MTPSPAPSPRPSVPLPGSFRDALPADAASAPLGAGEQVDFTVLLRRRAPLPPDLVHGPGTITRDELADRFGADPADLAAVRHAVEAAGLTVADVHAGSRRMTVAGPAGAAGALLGTRLVAARGTGRDGRALAHRARTGGLHVPPEPADVVVAVLGTDDRPHGRPLLSRPLLGTPGKNGPAHGGGAGPVAYTPPQLAEVYGFPPDTDGSGRIAALVEFGGGYEEAELRAYFSELGVTPPVVRSVGVAGAANNPGVDEDADGEVQLDIEVLGALAPGAELVVHFAPGTIRGYVEAVASAVHASPTPTVLSISWGAPEDHWTPQSLAALEEILADAAALGITVCAAAGDVGSTDGEKDGGRHVDYPGSSPHVLSVGGTSLRLGDDGGSRAGKAQGAGAGKAQDAGAGSGRAAVETVWNALALGGGATGGGRSATFPVPLWQRRYQPAGQGRPARGQGPAERRGVPDVAAVADPSTGYRIRVGGKDTTLGGTSAAAPLWAALVCRLSEALDAPLGLLAPLLYALEAPPAPLTDITSGDNGGYPAAVGWDACTGLGTPRGAALLAHLRASRTT